MCREKGRWSTGFRNFLAASRRPALGATPRRFVSGPKFERRGTNSHRKRTNGASKRDALTSVLGHGVKGPWQTCHQCWTKRHSVRAAKSIEPGQGHISPRPVGASVEPHSHRSAANGRRSSHKRTNVSDQRAKVSGREEHGLGPPLDGPGRTESTSWHRDQRLVARGSSVSDQDSSVSDQSSTLLGARGNEEGRTLLRSWRTPPRSWSKGVVRRSDLALQSPP